MMLYRVRVNRAKILSKCDMGGANGGTHAKKNKNVYVTTDMMPAVTHTHTHTHTAPKP